MENDNIRIDLDEILKSTSDKKEAYKKMLAYIHPIANNKGIVFTPEFKEKYDISEDNPMVFDEGFFEYGYYDEHFVLYSALLDDDVLEWLQFAYNSTHDDQLSRDNIYDRIQSIDSGYWALWITEYVVLKDLDENEDYSEDDPGKLYRRHFFEIKDHHFEIYSANSQFIDDETVEIEFIIEFSGGYDNFTIRTKKVEEYKNISKFAWNKKYDKLYELVEDDLRDEIYETISNSE